MREGKDLTDGLGGQVVAERPEHFQLLLEGQVSDVARLQKTIRGVMLLVSDHQVLSQLIPESATSGAGPAGSRRTWGWADPGR